MRGGCALIIPRGSKYPIIRYLGFWALLIMVQVLGKYLIIEVLGPCGILVINESTANLVVFYLGILWYPI